MKLFALCESQLPARGKRDKVAQGEGEPISHEIKGVKHLHIWCEQPAECEAISLFQKIQVSTVHFHQHWSHKPNVFPAADELSVPRPSVI